MTIAKRLLLSGGLGLCLEQHTATARADTIEFAQSIFFATQVSEVT